MRLRPNSSSYVVRSSYGESQVPVDTSDLFYYAHKPVDSDNNS